jgi:bacillopeptidase F
MYVTSRRTKLEQQKIIRQIAIFLLLAVILTAAFILVIIPNLFKFLANLSGATPTQSNDVPIQIPFLAAPVAATSSATLSLSGFSQKGYTVVVVDNSQEKASQSASDDGSFKTDITLDQGDNQLTVYAIDQNKKQSEASQVYHVKFSDQPPALEVSQPQDKASIQGKQNQKLTIQGKTDPQVQVYINDRLVFVKDDGSFSSVQQLNEGDNNFTVKAVDTAGNNTQKQFTVSFHS